MTEHEHDHAENPPPDQGAGDVARRSGLVIAIDGPSGSGKSSTSRGVAQRLGLRYLDTGAMYRATTWWMLTHGVDVTDGVAVAAHVRDRALLMGTAPAEPSVSIDGEDVSEAIRSVAVTAAVSSVSAVPVVRERLVSDQRAIIGAGGIVVEGRDIGTAVAPDAEVKVYLIASAAARAERRHAELGPDAGAVADTGAALVRRDTLDSTRAASPLAKAEDAVVIDSTDHSLEEVVDLIVGLAEGITCGR